MARMKPLNSPTNFVCRISLLGILMDQHLDLRCSKAEIATNEAFVERHLLLKSFHHAIGCPVGSSCIRNHFLAVELDVAVVVGDDNQAAITVAAQPRDELRSVSGVVAKGVIAVEKCNTGDIGGDRVEGVDEAKGEAATTAVTRQVDVGRASENRRPQGCDHTGNEGGSYSYSRPARRASSSACFRDRQSPGFGRGLLRATVASARRCVECQSANRPRVRGPFQWSALWCCRSAVRRGSVWWADADRSRAQAGQPSSR